MVNLALTLFVLLLLGPAVGVGLARLTGRLTWFRALAAALLCQLIVSLVMLQPTGLGGMPRRMYGPLAPHSPRDPLLDQLPILVTLSLSALLIAAGLTFLWHHFERRRSKSGPPPA
jgi:hypothetical protein